MPKRKTELLPCPRCGGAVSMKKIESPPFTFHYFRVDCCDAAAAGTDEEMAVKGWNTYVERERAIHELP